MQVMNVFDDPTAAYYTHATTTLFPTTSVTATPPAATDFPTIIPDPIHYQRASRMGEQCLWVVFVLMVVSFLGFTAMSWRAAAPKRFYHTISTAIIVAGALSYLGMALRQGFIWVTYLQREQHEHVPDTFKTINRQIFWARTVYWIIAIPLTLLNLGAVSGVSGETVVKSMVSAVVMVLTGYFATLGHTHGQKWGWYVISCLAYLIVVYHVVMTGRAGVRAKTANVARLYTMMSTYTAVVLAAYPVFWALTSISMKLSVNAEIIAYAIVDLLAQPVLCAWLLTMVTKVSDMSVEVGSFWEHGFGSGEGTIRIRDDDDA